MKRIKIIFLLFAMSISAVLITSCMNPEENDIKSSIMAPEPNNIMLEGTWKVIDVKQNADNMETNTDHITENLYISKKLFKFGNKSILSPNFTSKYINTNKFFNINYPGINPNNFTSNDNVEIVTISESEGISQEIIKLEENKILLIADGYLYFLERMSNTVDESIYLKYKEENIKTNIEAYNGKIGLSLSIINRAEEDASSYTDYSSYYVYYDNYKKENATLEAYKEPGIFLPNKNDFNVITFDEIWDGENYEGKLFKTLVTDDNIAASNKILDSDVPFELTFVSDKYISYSSSDVINSSNKYYRIRELNSVENPNYYNIQDIAGDEGLKLIKEILSKQNEKDSLNKKYNYPIDDYINIGLVRENGSWQFKTSLVLGDEELKYKDVNINIVPKIDIIKNKSSDIKWSEEKKKNENIIDMMYSPEKNFYMKLDNTNLYLYSIVNDEPLVTIKLPEGNKNLIKIEWIVGNNADLWKEYFIKAGGERIQI